MRREGNGKRVPARLSEGRTARRSVERETTRRPRRGLSFKNNTIGKRWGNVKRRANRQTHNTRKFWSGHENRGQGPPGKVRDKTTDHCFARRPLVRGVPRHGAVTIGYTRRLDGIAHHPIVSVRANLSRQRKYTEQEKPEQIHYTIPHI
jgi:hypothetical protein